MDLKLGNTSFQYHDGEIYQATLIFDTDGPGEYIHAEVAVLESSLTNESLANMTPNRLEQLGRQRVNKIASGQAKNEVYDLDLPGMSGTKMQNAAELSTKIKMIGEEQ